eukprot:526614-Pyramimonas_sp.AAC.1
MEKLLRNTSVLFILLRALKHQKLSNVDDLTNLHQMGRYFTLDKLLQLKEESPAKPPTAIPKHRLGCQRMQVVCFRRVFPHREKGFEDPLRGQRAPSREPLVLSRVSGDIRCTHPQRLPVAGGGVGGVRGPFRRGCRGRGVGRAHRELAPHRAAGGHREGVGADRARGALRTTGYILTTD